MNAILGGIVTLPFTGMLTLPLLILGALCVATGSVLSRITGRRDPAIGEIEGEPIAQPVSWRATERMDGGCSSPRSKSAAA